MELIQSAKRILRNLHDGPLTDNDREILAEAFIAFIEDEYIALLLTPDANEVVSLDTFHEAMDTKLNDELQAFWRSL